MLRKENRTLGGHVAATEKVIGTVGTIFAICLVSWCRWVFMQDSAELMTYVVVPIMLVWPLFAVGMIWAGLTSRMTRFGGGYAVKQPSADDHPSVQRWIVIHKSLYQKEQLDEDDAVQLMTDGFGLGILTAFVIMGVILLVPWSDLAIFTVIGASYVVLLPMLLRGIVLTVVDRIRLCKMGSQA